MNEASSTPLARAASAAPRYLRVYVWQWPVRAFHWATAAAVTMLFATGLYIAFPILTTNGEPYDNFLMARVRQVHFFAAFVFLVAYLWRAAFFVLGNRYARSGFPFLWRLAWWRAVARQAVDYVRFDFGEPHLGHNSLAGLSYALVPVGVGLLQMLTGFALFAESNPGGFWDGLVGWVIPLLGGSARTHQWHHLFAWVFLAFAIVHVYIVVLDARQYGNGLLSSMITGFKFEREGQEETDEL